MSTLRLLTVLLGITLAVGCGGGEAPAKAPAAAAPAATRQPHRDATGAGPLTRRLLAQSLALGKKHLLQRQRPEGSFHYAYNFATKRDSRDDSQVRQAGALWSLALIHRYEPSPETREAALRGISFFLSHTREAGGGARYIAYPGAERGRTGAVALVSLALIELLAAEPAERDKLRPQLAALLGFLSTLRLSSGLYPSEYHLADGSPSGKPSPYFDGEALLALSKAAVELGLGERAEILASAEAMHLRYVKTALGGEPDSAVTKGYYQWGTMAYYELFRSGWPEAQPFAERAVAMALWMIDSHRVLERRLNTAYAFEGLCTAWELARLTGRRAAQQKIGRAIEQGLYKLTTWQVGSPIESSFLRASGAAADPQALGGVVNSRRGSFLRIDVTQHQMHAVILARRFIYQAE